VRLEWVNKVAQFHVSCKMMMMMMMMVMVMMMTITVIYDFLSND
jgi:hypothetical protein